MQNHVIFDLQILPLETLLQLLPIHFGQTVIEEFLEQYVASEEDYCPRWLFNEHLPPLVKLLWFLRKPAY
jgi:hypothetical protein